MGECSITLDCDVLNADGGTRCASITGAWVALELAFGHLVHNRVIAASPMRGQVAAVSCGLVNGEARLDLDYAEDSGAGADANFVLTHGGGLVEVQASAEAAPFTEPQFMHLLRLARHGTDRLYEAQREALDAPPGPKRPRPGHHKPGHHGPEHHRPKHRRPGHCRTRHRPWPPPDDPPHPPRHPPCPRHPQPRQAPRDRRPPAPLGIHAAPPVPSASPNPRRPPPTSPATPP